MPRLDFSGPQPGTHASLRPPRAAVALFYLLIPVISFAWINGPSYAMAQPDYVTIVGSLQSELGCSDDWQPDCFNTHLTYDGDDGVWQGRFNVPAGSYEYKAAINNAWDENYGLHAQPNGANVPLNLGAPKDVKFYYDHRTHWVTDNVNSLIVTVPGNYQSKMGCAGDWRPDCLRSWLQDPDGDGVYTMTTPSLPAGSYECKIALNESWDENYGAGGVQNGPNILFTVPGSCSRMQFTYNASTHVLTVDPWTETISQPDYVTIAGSLQSELGCPNDWMPDCFSTHLTYDGDDGVWQGRFNIPAGSYEYKAAINNTWDENYGVHAQPNGANVPLNLGAPKDVKFYYDHRTHWVTDNVNSLIVTAPGSYQSKMGCAGDWRPDCLRSWLQDPDGDGVYTFCTDRIPPGNYEYRIAINESWDENYGQGGVQNGSNLSFSVPHCGSEVCFSYVAETHMPAITVDGVAYEAPTIVCPDWTEVEASTGACEAIVELAATVTGSPAPIVKYFIGDEEITSPHAFPVGPTNVVCRAENAIGAVECVFPIMVTDAAPPSVSSCPEDETLECPAEPAFGTPVFTDACDSQLTIDHADQRTDLACGYQVTRTWTATDDAGLTAQCDQTITVKDTTPPALVPKEAPIVLWPANHQYITLSATDFVQSVGDECDASVNAGSVRIVSATSSEPDDVKGPSDGNTTGDIVLASDGGSVRLRAERDTSGSGRVYTITLGVTDVCGNSASVMTRATVPLSVKKPRR